MVENIYENPYWKSQEIVMGICPDKSHKSTKSFLKEASKQKYDNELKYKFLRWRLKDNVLYMNRGEELDMNFIIVISDLPRNRLQSISGFVGV